MDETTDEDFSPGCSSVHQKRSEPMPSCVSMKSLDVPTNFNSEDTKPANSSVHQKRSEPMPSCVSIKSLDVPTNFKSEDARHGNRRITKDFAIKQSDNQPQDLNQCMGPGFSAESKLSKDHKLNLKRMCEYMSEGTSKRKKTTLLNEIYTELYITECESGKISNEHEVIQIETQSGAATEETPIKCIDIFKPLHAQDKHIRTVLTKGVAGIGKTVSVQKFILDFSEGRENQDVHLVFPLPFRELNLMMDKQQSLAELLHLLFPETKEMEISSTEYKVLFIFDGLDECRISLDFNSSVRLCDINKSASMDVILMNLIVGNLLPSALIWITSRPAAADLIPSKSVDRVTEVRGFSDPQKEEYFRKRISDESLANRIISHLKSSRSLYIMCHIPVFCWISATVLERMLSEAKSRMIPKTLTQMYTHFLIIQTDIKHQKDYEMRVKDEDMIFRLGQLAFEQLVKGNLIFYESDLRECGMDVAEASVYSGLCTQIFREDFGLYQGKVYCFVHLSIQEHLAALYAHVSFPNNQSPDDQQSWLSKMLNNMKVKSSKQDVLHELHHRFVDEALQSKNGHLDLFLRFLLGLSLESNQTLLQDLLKYIRRCSYKKEKTVGYIKEKIRENPSTEKSINLFYCLNELGDDSLLQEIQQYVKTRSVGESKFSSSQWAALVFMLLTFEQHLDELDLNAFIGGQNTADEVLVKLQLVIKECKNVQLSNHYISGEGCAALSSALRSNPSHLTQLNLTMIHLSDSGVKLLSAGLENPHCKLTSFRLSGYVTAEGCVALILALKSNPSHLRDLNLSVNNLRDSGVKLLSAGLKNPNWKLEKLKLSKCNFTNESCAELTSALRSNPSHLTDLDLSHNDLGDSGVKLLCTLLADPHCKLEILKLEHCKITDEGCAALASSLKSNSSHLTDLDLSYNNIGDKGSKLLYTVLANPHNKLKNLNLSDCDMTDVDCSAMDSYLRSIQKQ